MVSKFYKLLIYFLLIVVFESCISISEKRQKSVQHIAEVWEAENVNIEQISHGNGNEEVILSLYNLNAVDTSYSNQKITSSSALSFIRGLDNKEIESISTVKIVVDNKGKKFEKIFWKDSLVLALNLLPITDKYFDYGIDSNYNAFRNLFDKEYATDLKKEELFNFFNLVNKRSSLNGRVVTGFAFSELEIDGKKVLIVLEIINDDEYSYNFMFALNIESGKIIDVSINQ